MSVNDYPKSILCFDEENEAFPAPLSSQRPKMTPLGFVARALVGVGILLLLVWAFWGTRLIPDIFWPLGIFGALFLGGILWSIDSYGGKPAGIRNDGVFFGSSTSRGWVAWVLGLVFTLFYVLLYWFPNGVSGLVALVDPLSLGLFHLHANRWFLYGFLYTLAVLVMGIRMLYRYRHNKYQIYRTLSVMFFQAVFAFLVPHLLQLFDQPEFYFSYFWPLKYQYLFPDSIHQLMQGPGGVPVFMAFWTIAISLVGVPVLTYFFGKRWYCSWVCGCGGLAETAGDPWRHLSSKKVSAWRLERFLIHFILLLIVFLTVLLWVNSSMEGHFLGSFSQSYAHWYGFFIGSLFSGVIGVGFYPLLGSRVWCRFGCPQAAVLGIFQRLFSRFRITTNGGQCMSCGNCSTYCEMGIDVRAYAQRGENIVRASCVGCGICSAVCPRGVLKLENGGSPRFGKDFEKRG
jgi:Pyruvate/2-oxoacid:ferredoxin oxidoreductase delta subunit